MRPDLILFTPGPVRIPATVAEYLARPPCNYHRQEAFSRMFAETERDLKKLVGIADADGYFATIMTATGTGANEACLFALEPHGKGLLISNGFFGARVIDQARQNHMNVATLETAQDRPLDPAEITAVLDKDPAIKWVFFVSHETRTGLRNPFEAIGKLCKARGLLVAADAISSAYAYPIDIEASQIDLVTASSAKAIMAAPGLGIVFTRKASVDGIAGAGKPRGYYLDVVAEYKKQSAELQPRFAQPVALHAALRAACAHLVQLGIETHFARIQRQMQVLIDHLANRGVHPLVDAAYRSNIAVNFRLPAGLPYSDFSRRMEEQGYFCLYGIPGDQSHFQLSTIGDLTEAHIAGAQAALSRVFER
ncbi:MAG: alanine--glyoxylate aminotransferase family protein [Deltaproteobacteria bacterium]|nr:alanine--glyoxylate aminotransferase family protein [Deltaproteobacteria bacterium]MDQ3296728.1 aminotransferase class V-fold PLP-dependent enzyme [Myxococcota bacterium]